MGKNPSIIIKEQGAKARRKREKMDSVKHSGESVLDKASKTNKNALIYGFYDDLVKAFIVEGYTTKKAEKHIREWIDNDLLSMMWLDGFQLVGYDMAVF